MLLFTRAEGRSPPPEPNQHPALRVHARAPTAHGHVLEHAYFQARSDDKIRLLMTFYSPHGRIKAMQQPNIARAHTHTRALTCM